MLQGSLTALVTPFRDGKVDDAAFSSLVERQISAGTHGLVPCGTTGESATLSHAEHRRVISLCVEVANGRVPVLAGAGSNSTEEAIGLMRHAKEAGADAALIVAPYYNKPSQAGLVAHYGALCEAVDIPIVVYNIPGRSVVDIRPETLAEIARHPNVIGVKDSAGDPSRVATYRRLIGPEFVSLAGDDYLALGFAGHGARGCISVVSNVIPEACAAMQNALTAGDFETARQINDRLDPLHRALFVEPNPAPAKYALWLLGLCEPDVRLPLLALSEGAKTAVRDAMTHAGML
jgi:4-hydroxy-tetrahydrodipicolinate synthase